MAGAVALTPPSRAGEGMMITSQAHISLLGARVFTPEACCQARAGLLPLAVFRGILQGLLKAVAPDVDATGSWLGHRTFLLDGSSFSIPDTAKNRKEYPLTYNQKPGTGFPVSRIGAIISLSCEAILGMDAELRPPKVIYDRDQAEQRC
jgi:hypothetical protein